MMLLVMQCSLVSFVSFLGSRILLRMLCGNGQADVPGLTFIDLKVDLYWLLNEIYFDFKCKHLVL